MKQENTIVRHIEHYVNLAIRKLPERSGPGSYKTLYESYDECSPTDKSYIKAAAKPICKAFFDTKEYKSGDKSYVGYKACCEEFDFCSFYKQTWFYIVCAGAVFLLLLVAFGVFSLCVWRKKKRDNSSKNGKGYVEKAEKF